MVIKRRSPNYPGINLEEATQVIATLYQGSQPGQGVGRGQFTPQDAARAWGYTSISGPTKTRLASLRQYALVEGKKGGNPRLSERALTLILRNQASREHRQAIWEAALTPPIFAELHQRMAGAAEDALRQFLIVERNFTDEGANRLIAVYQASVGYAGLDVYANMAGQKGDGVESEIEEEEEAAMTPSLLPTEGTMTIPLPLSRDKIGTLTVPIDMDDEDWKRLDRILKAYKPEQETPLTQPELHEDSNGDIGQPL